MTLDEMIESLPAYAKDLKLNFSSLVRQQTELTPQQLWETVVASAIAARPPPLAVAAVEAARQHLSVAEIDAAKAVAAMMGMTNIYYRFLHLTSNEKYKTLPAKLRMNVMRTHGTDAIAFDLAAVAVSAINGCGACVDSHEQELRKRGLGEAGIAAAIRIASVMHAIGVTLAAEGGGENQALVA